MKDSLPKLLRSAGLRATPQRLLVLKLLQARKRPLSVEALVKAGKGLFDTATAYRTLDALSGRGLVRRITLAPDRALYEAAGDHHHHAICSKCGKIQDVSSCIPASLDERARVASGFAHIESHALEFFGLCTVCAR